MIKLKSLLNSTNLLTEGFSPVVYHWIDTEVLVKMLESDTAILSVAFATDTDRNANRGKLYYWSLSRAKWGGYSRSRFYEKNTGIIIELDGVKLGHNYKSISVDYWGREYRNLAFNSKQVDDFYRLNENEERLISDTDTIPNIKKYIIAIHVYIPENMSNYSSMTRMQSLSGMFSPIYYYSDPQAFKLLNKNKASKTVPNMNVEKPEGYGEYISKYSANSMRDANALVELFYSTDYSHLSEAASRLRYDLMYMSNTNDYQILDRTNSIEADIHNRKKDQLYREDIKKFGTAMKKAGANSVKDFLRVVSKQVKQRELDNPSTGRQ